MKKYKHKNLADQIVNNYVNSQDLNKLTKDIEKALSFAYKITVLDISSTADDDIEDRHR